MKHLFLLLFSILFFVPAKSQSKDTIPQHNSFYIGGDSSCLVTIGYFPDDDVMEFVFRVDGDSVERQKNYRLLLYDRWGNMLADEKGTFWETEELKYTRDIIVWRFSYVDKSGEKKVHVGTVYNSVW